MKIFNLFFILLISINVHAQFFSIEGKVLSIDEEPLEYINVNILNDSSHIIVGTRSDSLGRFRLEVEKGQYILELNQFGTKFYSKVVDINSSIDLGPLIIDPSIILDAITIKNQDDLIEQKIDRYVFNIDQTALATGANGLNILEITPGLMVNQNRISILGKAEGVGVMVNGKILQMSPNQIIDYLQGLQSDQIKSIEIITSPPAKYSAEGNSGLINIILKKPRKDQWRTIISSSYRQGIYAQSINSVNYYFKKNNLSIGTGVNYSFGKYKGEEYLQVIYPENIWNSNTESINKKNNLSGHFILDYDLNKKITTGIQYNGSLNKPNVSDIDNSVINNSISSREVVTKGISNKKKRNNALNYHLKYTIDTLGKELNIDIDYFNYNTESERNFIVYNNNNLLSDQENINSGDLSINNYSVNLDMNHPTKFIDLNYGGRVSFSKIDNYLFSDIYDVGFIQNDQYNYDENTQSLFISGEKELSNKFSFKLGLRIENTQIEADSKSTKLLNTYNYTELFPSFYLSYRLNNNNNFSFSYNRRINRPSFSNLNPFRYYSSPFYYWEGNPSLTPSFTHNLELNYKLKKYSRTSLFFQSTKDMYGGVVIIDNDNVNQLIKPLNYTDTETFGISQTFINNINKIRLYYGGYGGYQKSKSKIYPITPKEIDGFYSVLYMYFNYKFNEKINTGFNYQQVFPNVGLDLTNNKARSILNLYLSAIINDKITLVLNVNNLFREYSFNSTSERNGNFVETNGFYDNRYVKLTIKINLGGKVKVSDRQIKNKEEINRSY
ncbi:outer membrane beta-barrel family protein [Flammeovirga kamogawensis]|uniref:TonB-dependent receptor family protein n=1 Tax=Flammeovirga kamogawensis TaxID=373891 RepID=A0ABX8H3Y6_9BACT|nr:outer membrane beta-barrel family protein [Flammeovirga kamogawensis]MBB6463544.1 hypothetical protein [Flammeovirga kamogawensis]QWG10599.1 TonB-dependent receptor family protein [Flammeovirga kamogawensis]TRX63704.1 TonB-dependent receptor [Flammeovirga kamogawensis]